MCVAAQLTGGRLDFGVGRGVAPIEHAWFGTTWPQSRQRFDGHARDHLRRIRDRRDLEREQRVSTTSRPCRSPTKPLQEPIPFWYPGNPVTAGPSRHEPDVARPDRPAPPTTSTSRRGTSTGRHDPAWKGRSSEPRVGCTMLLAIAPTEDGGTRHRPARHGRSRCGARTNVHKHDHLVLPADEVRRGASPPSKHPRAHIEDAVNAGAGTRRPDHRAFRPHPRARAAPTTSCCSYRRAT